MDTLDFQITKRHNTHRPTQGQGGMMEVKAVLNGQVLNAPVQLPGLLFGTCQRHAQFRFLMALCPQTGAALHAPKVRHRRDNNAVVWDIRSPNHDTHPFVKNQYRFDAKAFDTVVSNLKNTLYQAEKEGFFAQTLMPVRLPKMLNAQRLPNQRLQDMEEMQKSYHARRARVHETLLSLTENPESLMFHVIDRKVALTDPDRSHLTAVTLFFTEMSPDTPQGLLEEHAKTVGQTLIRLRQGENAQSLTQELALLLSHLPANAFELVSRPGDTPEIRFF